MSLFARVLRAIADRIDPPVAIAVTVPVCIDGREVARAVTSYVARTQARR